MGSMYAVHKRSARSHPTGSSIFRHLEDAGLANPRRQAQRWTRDNVATLETAVPELPAGFDNRLSDNSPAWPAASGHARPPPRSPEWSPPTCRSASASGRHQGHYCHYAVDRLPSLDPRPDRGARRDRGSPMGGLQCYNAGGTKSAGNPCGTAVVAL